MRKPSLSKRVINGFEVMAMHLERDPVQLLFGKSEDELNAQERGDLSDFRYALRWLDERAKYDDHKFEEKMKK